MRYFYLLQNNTLITFRPGFSYREDSPLIINSQGETVTFLTSTLRMVFYCIIRGLCLPYLVVTSSLFAFFLEQEVYGFIPDQPNYSVLHGPAAKFLFQGGI